MGPGRGIAPLAAALWALAIAAPASARPIAVTDATSDPALAIEAGALTAIVRSHLGSRSRRVPFGELAAAVERVGPGAPDRLAVAPDKLRELAAALDGAIVVAPTLTRRGRRLEATAAIVAADGETSALEPVTANLGQIRELGQKLVEAAGGATGQLSTRVKPTSAAELGAVARAARALAAGDLERAAALVAGARPRLGLKLAAVADITRPIAEAESLPLDFRLTAALVGGDLEAARAIARAAGDDPIAAAGLARVAVTTVDDRAARRALRGARRSSAPFVILARVARAGELGGGDQLPALITPLVQSDPYVPALAMATRFRPGLLGAAEADLITAAARVRDQHPELATALGMRAVRDGRASPEIFDLIDGYLLGDPAVRELYAALKKAPPDDADAARLAAEIALRTGDIAAARPAHAKARALDPDDPRLPRTAAILDEIEPEDRRSAAAAASTDDDGSEAEALTAALALLVDDLAPVLAEFPIEADGVRRLILAPLPGSDKPWFWPRRLHPERLAEALAAVLKSPRFGVEVVKSPLETAARPSAAELAALAESHDAGATLLYGLDADGGDALVRLIYYSASSGAALEGKTRIVDASDHGLVSINPVFVGGLAVAVGGVLLWLVFTAVRGSGMIRIELKVDPAANKPSFSILISKKNECPAVTDPKEHLDSVKVAEKRRRFGADNVGATEEFERIPPGRWFVHVYGTYGKGGELRALPPLTEPARVRRNQVTTVIVDLVPKESEFHFVVTDQRGPARGAVLHLDSSPGHRVVSDEDGKAILFAPTGEHTVHIKYAGAEIERNIHAYGSRISTVPVNVDRERRLAQIAGGLDVELEPEDEPPEIVAPRPAGGGGEMRGLDRYRPEVELGRGAMGVVYRASDQVLGRQVALKVMSAAVREHPTAAQMFEQEARALAALNHPNVVTVYDQGRDGAQMFLVMELVSGMTLEKALSERARLELAAAARIGEQLGRGLAYAHGRRVIHRDIKPGNVFLTDDGTVKLGDFGLARVINEVSIKRTEVKGTPLYMAPEQIRGADIDFRADIYALGCTLFEVLAGRPPFIEGEILYHHLNTEPPRLSSLVEVPEPVDALIMKCIAKEARERPASADRIADVFGKLRRG